jgi:hypothetical protein
MITLRYASGVISSGAAFMHLDALLGVPSRFGCAIAVWAVVCAGCGRSDDVQRVAMHGNVLLDGSPLEAGSISLLPAAGHDGPTANARIEKGGYRFDRATGPTAGTYRVLVMHSASNVPSGKVQSFGSPSSRREWELKAVVPDAREFEHNIELK